MDVRTGNGGKRWRGGGGSDKGQRAKRRFKWIYSHGRKFCRFSGVMVAFKNSVVVNET